MTEITRLNTVGDPDNSLLKNMEMNLVKRDVQQSLTRNRFQYDASINRPNLRTNCTSYVFAWCNVLAMFAMFACISASVQAGQFNRVLSIGDPAPAWNDLIGVDDQRHSLADLKDAKAVVVVFTCNSCPYSVDVEDRLVALHKEFQPKGVAVVAINVNTIDEDRLPAMKSRAEAKGFSFPYLFDETQKIGRDYGAIYTPQFFVLDGKRRVAYMGSMDDSPDGRSIKKTYVRQAIQAVLMGENPEVTETPPVGCRIRYERVRRTRRSKSDQ